MGSHVADKLLDAGYKVRIFDQRPSLWIRAGQEMVVGDITIQEEVKEATREADIVYNFAGLADLNKGLVNPLETVRMNVLGNMHILEASKLHGVKRFVYASTVYVYSREGGFYRCSKQACEHYVEEYQ